MKSYLPFILSFLGMIIFFIPVLFDIFHVGLILGFFIFVATNLYYIKENKRKYKRSHIQQHEEFIQNVFKKNYDNIRENCYKKSNN